MGRAEGKVVIVTGGASGMGKEDAHTLAREGARVMLTDLNEDAGHAVVKEIGAAVIFMRHDISSEDDWKAVITATEKRFGKINGLVNNAGVLLMASIEDTTMEQWHKIHRINSDGYFLGCKYGVAAMTAFQSSSLEMSCRMNIADSPISFATA